MNWVITENNKKINTLEIPTISIDEIKSDFEKFSFRLVGFFGKEEFENIQKHTCVLVNLL